MSINLRRVPGAVWAFIAVVIILLIVAWLGYNNWAEIPKVAE